MENTNTFQQIIIGFFVVLLSASGFCEEGGLSLALIEQIQRDFCLDEHRTVYNSLTNNKIKDLALNRQIVHNHNEFFSDKVKVTGITNQKSSGRCWIFAALNSLRPAVIEKQNLKSFEFSQNYLAFWDKMEKSNAFLQYMIDFRNRDLMDREVVWVLQHNLFTGDGGYWENFSDLAKKYGLVPKEIMPETKSSSSTGMMNRFLYQKLRSDVVKLHKMHKSGRDVKDLVAEKEKMLAEVYRILVLNLGQPPKEFTWRYKPKKEKDEKDKDDNEEDKDEDDEDNGTVEKDETTTITMTPKQFMKEFVGINLDDYINVFHDTIRPAGKYYQIRMSRNGYDSRDISYVNVDLDTLKKIAIDSIRGGDAMLFAADVSHDQSSEKGIMADGMFDYESLYGLEAKMTKAERALYRQSVRNHGMNLVGVDIKDGTPLKWRVENSWGTDSGSKGFWTMYDDWFDIHVYNIIVLKKYVPKEVQDIAKQPPVILPPWDPML
jgi:bleomycin hydrolase